MCLILFCFLFLLLFSPSCLFWTPCRWIQSISQALAHWPVLECVHYRQIVVSWLVPPEALRPAGVKHCLGPRQGTEDCQETVHPEQTLPETTSHQSAPRKVTSRIHSQKQQLNGESIICHYWAVGSLTAPQQEENPELERVQLLKSPKVLHTGRWESCQWLSWSLSKLCICRLMALCCQLFQHRVASADKRLYIGKYLLLCKAVEHCECTTM